MTNGKVLQKKGSEEEKKGNKSKERKKERSEARKLKIRTEMKSARNTDKV